MAQKAALERFCRSTHFRGKCIGIYWHPYSNGKMELALKIGPGVWNIVPHTVGLRADKLHGPDEGGQALLIVSPHPMPRHQWWRYASRRPNIAGVGYKRAPQRLP